MLLKLLSSLVGPRKTLQRLRRRRRELLAKAKAKCRCEACKRSSLITHTLHHPITTVLLLLLSAVFRSLKNCSECLQSIRFAPQSCSFCSDRLSCALSLCSVSFSRSPLLLVAVAFTPHSLMSTAGKAMSSSLVLSFVRVLLSSSRWLSTGGRTLSLLPLLFAESLATYLDTSSSMRIIVAPHSAGCAGVNAVLPVLPSPAAVSDDAAFAMAVYSPGHWTLVVVKASSLTSYDSNAGHGRSRKVAKSGWRDWRPTETACRSSV